MKRIPVTKYIYTNIYLTHEHGTENQHSALKTGGFQTQAAKTQIVGSKNLLLCYTYYNTYAFNLLYAFKF